VAILRGRKNAQVLWVNARGLSLDGSGAEACRTAADTRRVGTLLRLGERSADLSEQDVRDKAEKEVWKIKERTQRIWCIWEDCVVEKAESEKGDGWGPVLSSKARRHGRPTRGVIFNWPAPRPVRVIGMPGTAAVIVGMQGLPHRALRSRREITLSIGADGSVKQGWFDFTNL
jgi:hypothetical protein